MTIAVDLGRKATKQTKVSADNNLNKVQFFLENDMLLNLKSCLTDELIWALRLRFFNKI